MNVNESESSKDPRLTPELEEAVRNAFRILSEKLKGGDRIFVDENGDRCYIVLTNPAGNLSIDNVKTHDSYLLWENGEISASSIGGDYTKVVNLPSPDELNALISEIGRLTEQELPKEPK